MNWLTAESVFLIQALREPNIDNDKYPPLGQGMHDVTWL